MKATERNYLMSRINKIKNTKRQEMYLKDVEEYKTKILKALKEGKFKINTSKKDHSIDNLSTFITFNKSLGEKPWRYSNKYPKLDEYVQNLQDEIMLGSSEVVLKMLKDFEKKQF